MSIIPVGYGPGINFIPPTGGGGGGDLGDGNVWRSSSTGVTGINEALATAGDNLVFGDTIITGWLMNPEIFLVVPGQNGELYVVPTQLPDGERLVPTGIAGFKNQVPADGSWSDISRGTGAWSLDGTTVVGASVDTGSNEARASAGDQTADRALLVLSNVQVDYNTGSNNEAEIICAVSTSNRYASLRITSNVWNMDGTSASAINPNTTNDIEILCDGAGNAIYWRFNRAGAWSTKTFSLTFALNTSARIVSDRVGASTVNFNLDSACLVTL